MEWLLMTVFSTTFIDDLCAISRIGATLLIAGTQSGCGKTTATLALMQYLRAHGKQVAPFKAGPDFLDPMWHDVACGRTSYNIDTRMIGAKESLRLLHAKSANADVVMIEGVMGLFDGRSGVGGEGSSAHLAKVLNEPVILVVSAKGMSGSIVALVEGFVARAKAMDVNIAGIVANHVGSENHAKILRELLRDENLPPLMAWLNKDAPPLPERHLGLKMPSELDLPDFSDALHVEDDFKSSTAEARRRGGKTSGDVQHQKYPDNSAENTASNNNIPLYSSVPPRLCGKIIAIARDASFCFIYPANIEWLQAQGAEITYFSPLASEPIPEHADALWLPGGYPELHLEALRQSTSLASIRDFIESNKPVLAECGGMMLLGQSILTAEARRRGEKPVNMMGVLPCFFEMQDKLAGLGYREDESGVRGHEFHHSKRFFTPDSQSRGEEKEAFKVARGDAGIRYKNLRASYIHWYFPSQSEEVVTWFRG